ncbi:MAG TPA: DUF296 domain-containing protein [Syntrophomonas sp.]|nr:DUF296 domain-containing protein [Syntrophomonas sp.]
MNRAQAIGQINELIFARMEPGEDLLKAIWDISARYEIKAGWIVEGSGMLKNVIFQRFPHNFKTCKIPIDLYNLDGPMLCNISGIIGTMRNSGGDASVLSVPYCKGVIEEEMDLFAMSTSQGFDTPYVHCHFDVSTKDTTVMGHLMPGTIVAEANTPGDPTEFTLVIAKMNSVDFGTAFRPDGFGHFVEQIQTVSETK